MRTPPRPTALRASIGLSSAVTGATTYGGRFETAARPGAASTARPPAAASPSAGSLRTPATTAPASGANPRAVTATAVGSTASGRTDWCLRLGLGRHQPHHRRVRAQREQRRLGRLRHSPRQLRRHVRRVWREQQPSGSGVYGVARGIGVYGQSLLEAGIPDTSMTFMQEARRHSAHCLS